MKDDYTPQQRMVMVGPGFMDGLVEGIIGIAIVAVIVAALIGFGVGWLVFG